MKFTFHVYPRGSGKTTQALQELQQLGPSNCMIVENEQFKRRLRTQYPTLHFFTMKDQFETMFFDHIILDESVFTKISLQDYRERLLSSCAELIWYGSVPDESVLETFLF